MPIVSTKPRATDPWSVKPGDSLLAIGEGWLRSHRITSDEVVIGRDASCDFVLDHATLSRRHAVLSFGPLAVRDLDSTNGTHVGGVVVRGGAAVPLADRSGFQIGPFTFVIVASTGNTTERSGRHILQVVDPTPSGVPALVHELARSDVNLLIVAETGTGKEVLATTIHALSERGGPFVRVNCAALSESLLESELFGHERGAFTGAVMQKPGLIEAAAGGTLLLDEIGELTLGIQAKLLRAIEQREILRLGSTRTTRVDVRFLASTHRDLVTEVAAGTFRADLFYRLDGVTLSIPPLRERRGAIVPLAFEFLAARAPDARITADAVAALEAHTWPGNVRELKAVIERAALLAGGRDVEARHVVFAAAPERPIEELSDLNPDERADRDRIADALERCAGNQSRAAKLLGMSRTALITRLRIYKLTRPHARRR